MKIPFVIPYDNQIFVNFTSGKRNPHNPTTKYSLHFKQDPQCLPQPPDQIL